MPSIAYNDSIKVLYSVLEDTYGGGTEFGQEFIELFGTKGIRPGGRVFEFCAGHGFIGFSLLAHGLCETLCLADVRGEAIEFCRKTVRENRLEGSVTVYESDGLESIPADEQWDIVVSNPPHFVTPVRKYGDRFMHFYLDRDWALHRRFYSSVKRFLARDGEIIMQEHSLGSHPETFRPMIEEHGLKITDTYLSPRFEDIYYIHIKSA